MQRLPLRQSPHLLYTWYPYGGFPEPRRVCRTIFLYKTNLPAQIPVYGGCCQWKQDQQNDLYNDIDSHGIRFYVFILQNCTYSFNFLCEPPASCGILLHSFKAYFAQRAGTCRFLDYTWPILILKIISKLAVHKTGFVRFISSAWNISLSHKQYIGLAHIGPVPCALPWLLALPTPYQAGRAW